MPPLEGSDTAGDGQGRGEVVRGLRVLIEEYDRSAPLLWTMWWYVAFWKRTGRWRVLVTDLPGRRIHAQRSDIHFRRQARRVRARFIARVEALTEDELATVELPSLLRAIPTGLRA